MKKQGDERVMLKSLKNTIYVYMYSYGKSHFCTMLLQLAAKDLILMNYLFCTMREVKRLNSNVGFFSTQCFVKGTVARDFWPLVFIMNRPHMDP
jgi:hypothetical protein